MNRVMFFVLTASLLFFAGCGGEKETGNSGKKKEKAAESASAKNEKAAKVVLSESQPPFDGGRLTFSTPKGWVLQSKRDEYVAWFRGPKGAFPHMYVSAEAVAKGVTELTSENAREAVPALGDKKIKFKTHGEKNSWVSYEQKGQSYSLAAIREGRLYIFEIRTAPDDLKQKTKDTLDAILASAKFDEAGTLAAGGESEEGGFFSGLNFGDTSEAEEKEAEPEE